MKTLEAQIQNIIDRASASVQNLADEWRERTLIPFCRRHRLTFVSGMGHTAFFRGERPVDADDIAAIGRMDETLNLLVLHQNDWFGLYVSDVTSEDLRKT